MNSKQHEALNEKLNDDLLTIFMDLVNGRTDVSNAMDRVNNRVDAAYDLGVAMQAAELAALQGRVTELETERDTYRRDLACALMASGDDEFAGTILFKTWEEIAAQVVEKKKEG